MFTKDKILELLKDPKAYLEVVSNTHGFLFEKTKELNIDIPSEILDSLKATDFGTALLNIPYVKKENLISVVELLEGSYRDDSSLDREDKTLSLDFINKNSKKILEVPVDANSGLWRQLWDLIDDSVKNLSLDEFLKLDKGILKSKLSLFATQKSNIQDERFKKLYKELVLLDCFEKNVLPDPMNLSFYYFTNNDKDFLADLLNNQAKHLNVYSKSITYNILASKVPGFRNQVTTKEYVLNFNPLDVKSLPSNELSENLELYKQNIQSHYLDKLKSDPSSFSLDDLAISGELPIDFFKEVITDDFIIKLLQNSSYNYHLRNVSSASNSDKLEKILVIFKSVLNVSKDNLEIIDSYDVIDAMNILGEQLSTSDYKGLREEYSDELNKLFNQYMSGTLKKATKNFNLVDTIDLFKHYLSDKSNERLDLIKSNVNQSVNLFFILSESYRDLINNQKSSKDLQFQENLKLYIQEMYLALKDKNDIVLGDILNSLSIKDKILNGLNEIKSTHLNQVDISANIFNLLDNDISELPQELVPVIGTVYTPKIYKTFLESSPSIDSDTLKNHFLYNGFFKYENVETRNERYSFLKSYIEKNRLDLEKDKELVRSLVKHDAQKIIYPYIDYNSQQEYFDNILSSLRLIKKCDTFSSIIKNKYIDKLGSYYPKDIPSVTHDNVEELFNSSIEGLNRDEVLNLLDSLYTLTTQSNHIVNEESQLLTPNFLNQKALEFVLSENFEDSSLLFKQFRRLDNLYFVELVNNLSPKELKRLILDESFANMISQTISYEGMTDICFKKMSCEDIEFVSSYYKKHTDPKTIKYLRLFKDSDEEFKKYIIKNEPEGILGSFRFLQYSPKKEQKGNVNRLSAYDSILKTPYSSNEIIQILDNIKNNDNFFSNNDINARVSDNIAELFETDVGFESLEDKVRIVLNHCKKNNPIAYLMIVSDSQLMGMLSSDDKSRKPRDLIFHETFLKIADYDALHNSIKCLANYINNNPVDTSNLRSFKYNSKLMCELLRNHTYLTFATDLSNNDAFITQYSHIESESILGELYEKLPLYTVTNVKSYGTVESVIDNFKVKLGSVYDFEMLNTFIAPKDAQLMELNYSYKKERFLDLVNHLVSYLGDKGLTEDLEYMSYCLKLYSDNDNYDLDDDKRFRAHVICEHNKYDFTPTRTALEDENLINKIERAIEYSKLNKSLKEEPVVAKRKMKI